MQTKKKNNGFSVQVIKTPPLRAWCLLMNRQTDRQINGGLAGIPSGSGLLNLSPPLGFVVLTGPD